MTPVNWRAEVVEQLDFDWKVSLRPRLEGLTDEEYFWEPVPGWNLHPRGQGATESQGGSGDWTIDWAWPEPEPAPVTTIARRLAHIVVGVLGARNASHFGRDPVDYLTWDYAGTAEEALAQLDAEYERWVSGVKSLGAEGLARPCGPAEGPFAEVPLAALVLHIHREVIHHGAEVALLRDLYAHC